MNGGLAGFIGTALVDRILTNQTGVLCSNRRKTYVQLNQGITLEAPEYQMQDLPGPRSHGGWRQHAKNSKNKASASMLKIQSQVQNQTEHTERVEIVEHMKFGNLRFTKNTL